MRHSDEFPLLEGVGLYASDISGDGNCLFHALSDQVCPLLLLLLLCTSIARAYGFIIRQSYTGMKIITQRFGRGSLNICATMPATSNSSLTAIDDAFTQHLNRMAKSGVYGDNMEISAFAREYGCDVKIYQRDFAYVVTGGEVGADEGRGRGDSGRGEKKRVLHIAYHAWEHYSSVRNRDGPHTGPPHVSPVALTEEGRKEQEKKLASGSHVQPWMVNVVTSSLPYLTDSRRIREALEEAKGDIDAAVSRLLDVEEGEDEQQQEEENEKKKEYANESGDVKEMEKVDVAPGEGGKIEEKEAEKADAQGSLEIQDNVDKVHDPAADTNGAKTPKRPTPKTGARASARIKAREDSRSSPGAGSGPENSSSAAEGTRKQQPPQPKKVTPRERKAKQKAAAKQKKKEKALGNKDAESERGTAVITTGIKELYV
ncbi:hypothetical protein C7212DRAFT_177773 [Tuber magnatum]|uniref:OTU domain-containing protein n=1 Tax=Tuber magnatum TaxID=42249 RepID=A0A317STN6_9PEZI|nr:hypothetical protein C7212DRAFT_177773 [Tuber magnatum]